MVWRVSGLLFCLIGISFGTFGEIEGTCPHFCPGECAVIPALWLDVRDPELGISRMRCVQAECPLTPWCFEVYGTFPLLFSRFAIQEKLLEQFLVSTNGAYLTGPGIHAKAEGRKATVCIESAYEFPIVTVDKEGRSAVTKVPVGGIRGVACMGKCPCSSFLWIKPFVTVSSKATGIPRVAKILIKVSDPNDDVVCVGHDIFGNISPQLSLAPPEAFWTAFYTTGSCIDSLDIVLPCDTEHVVVRAWAKDLKGLEGHDFAVIGAGNRPPEVRGKLSGEATVVLYPDRVEVSPVVVRGEVFDPEGDQVFVEAPLVISPSLAAKS